MLHYNCDTGGQFSLVDLSIFALEIVNNLIFIVKNYYFFRFFIDFEAVQF